MMYNNILNKICHLNDLNDLNDHNIYNIYDRLGIDHIDKKNRFELLNTEINNILNNYYEEGEEIILNCFKDDMIFVLILDKISIKIYTKIKFDNVRELYDILIKNENQHLEHIYEIINIDIGIDNYVIVVSETLEIEDVIQIITCKDIDEQIIKGSLKYLNDNGWIHNDTSLDNIGYKKKSDKDDIICFVLFDFEKSKKLSKINKNNDIYSIYKSFKLNNS